MIYITGDCHQDFERFNIDVFPEQKEMTKDDCVIICGDPGGVWNRNEESSREAKLMDWLENRPLTTLCPPGACPPERIAPTTCFLAAEVFCPFSKVTSGSP